MKGTHTIMMKKHKLFHLSAPSQIKQTLGCAFFYQKSGILTVDVSRVMRQKNYTQKISQ